MIPLLVAFQVVASGSVSGRVVTGGDAPIAGATVQIEALDRSVRTAEDGRYRFPDLPEGRWLLEVDAGGFLGRGVVVRVSDGGTVSLDIELERRPEAALQGGTLSGVVLEQGRLEPLHFARVEVVPLGREVLTDEDGLFTVGGVPPGPWTLRVSAPGYVPLERAIPPEQSGARIELRLTPRPLPLAELVVRGRAAGAQVQARAPEARIVDSVLVSLAPTVVERDVLRAVQTLPSVTPMSDFSAAPSVRGGTPGQTRVVLDGTPLHNPFHVGGFVSAFEPSAVDAAVLRPGGLPASAPSGLSGILEINTRDGGRDSVRVAGGLGLLSSALTASGPWRHGSWLLSGRRTYIDLASAALNGTGITDADWPYRFWDLLGKVTTDVGGRGRSLTVSSYLDREGFHDGDTYRGVWGSDALSVRFRGLVLDDLMLDAAVATSGFVADFTRAEDADSLEGGVRSELDASVRTWLAEASVARDVAAHLVSVGVRAERTTASQDLDPRGGLLTMFTPGEVAGRYGTTALYVRDRWRVSDRFALDVGVRAEKAPGRAWTTLPRGRLEWAPAPGSTLALSSGTYVQDWWSLRNEEDVAASVVAYDVTAPVPADLPLSRARDVGLELRTDVAGWSLRAEAFHKRMWDVPTSPPVADPSDARVTLALDSIRLGEQRVDGVELSLTGSFLGSPLALSYRLQRERARLEGEVFTPRRARTHRLVVNTLRRWGERQVAIGVTWMSGRPYTPPLAALPVTGDPDGQGRLGPARFGRPGILLGAANSARTPAYLRVDVDARGAWDLTLFGRKGTLEPYLSVLNLFNGNNTLWVSPQVRNGALVLEAGPQLPLFPTIGLRWRF